MRKNLRIVFAISTTLDGEESQPGGKINEKLFRTLSETYSIVDRSKYAKQWREWDDEFAFCNLSLRQHHRQVLVVKN